MLLVCIVIVFQSSKITEMSFYHFTTEKKMFLNLFSIKAIHAHNGMNAYFFNNPF